jgi:superoxide dismutase, Cu-Zn family
MPRFLISIAPLFICGCLPSPAVLARPIAITATAPILRNGDVIGVLKLEQQPNGISMRLSMMGPGTGSYAMHLHEIGKCDGPDYASAGAHWNPKGKQHGVNNPMGSHAGDLPDLISKTGQVTEWTANLPGAMLMGDGGLLDGDGAAIIMHAGPDDGKTDPSGNSGARIACGVIVAG